MYRRGIAGYLIDFIHRICVMHRNSPYLPFYFILFDTDSYFMKCNLSHSFEK